MARESRYHRKIQTSVYVEKTKTLAQGDIRGLQVKDVELLVLRHELEILRRRVARPELRMVDRALLAAAASHLPAG
jgi:hypothetical protein